MEKKKQKKKKNSGISIKIPNFGILMMDQENILKLINSDRIGYNSLLKQFKSHSQSSSSILEVEKLLSSIEKIKKDTTLRNQIMLDKLKDFLNNSDDENKSNHSFLHIDNIQITTNSDDFLNQTINEFYKFLSIKNQHVNQINIYNLYITSTNYIKSFFIFDNDQEVEESIIHIEEWLNTIKHVPQKNILMELLISTFNVFFVTILRENNPLKVNKILLNIAKLSPYLRNHFFIASIKKLIPINIQFNKKKCINAFINDFFQQLYNKALDFAIDNYFFSDLNNYLDLLVNDYMNQFDKYITSVREEKQIIELTESQEAINLITLKSNESNYCFSFVFRILPYFFQNEITKTNINSLIQSIMNDKELVQINGYMVLNTVDLLWSSFNTFFENFKQLEQYFSSDLVYYQNNNFNFWEIPLKLAFPYYDQSNNILIEKFKKTFEAYDIKIAVANSLFFLYNNFKELINNFTINIKAFSIDLSHTTFISFIVDFFMNQKMIEKIFYQNQSIQDSLSFLDKINCFDECQKSDFINKLYLKQLLVLCQVVDIHLSKSNVISKCGELFSNIMETSTIIYENNLLPTQKNNFYFQQNKILITQINKLFKQYAYTFNSFRLREEIKMIISQIKFQ